MYLVEEFKDALHLKLKPRTLEQAISNVQVVITLRTRKYAVFHTCLYEHVFMYAIIDFILNAVCAVDR